MPALGQALFWIVIKPCLQGALLLFMYISVWQAQAVCSLCMSYFNLYIGPKRKTLLLFQFNQWGSGDLVWFAICSLPSDRPGFQACLFSLLLVSWPVCIWERTTELASMRNWVWNHWNLAYKLHLKMVAYYGLRLVRMFLWVHQLQQMSHSGGGCWQWGRVVHVWEQRVCGQSLYLLLNFAGNLKMLENPAMF